MNLKTYQADSMSEALTQVRDELGPDAVIVKTRQTLRKLLGRQKTCYEVTAAIDRPFSKSVAAKSPALPPIAPARPEAKAPPKAPVGLYDWKGHLPRVSSQPQAVSPAAAEADSLRSLRADMDQMKEQAKMPTREMHRLREEIQGMLEAASAPVAAHGSAWLQAMDLPPDLAHELWRRAGSGSGEDARDPEVIRRTLPRMMAEDLHCAGGIRLQAGRPARVLILGPSGSGKTSLIQKLAIQGRLQAGKRVGILSADPRRFGAHGELALFAKTLGLPAAGVYDAREIPAALHALRGCEIILADAPALPAGAGHDKTLDALRRAFVPDETHLVLNACTRAREMRRIVEAGSRLRASRLSFTHLDECLGFGALYAAARDFSGEIGYLVWGPAASEHVEAARCESLRDWFTRGIEVCLPETVPAIV